MAPFIKVGQVSRYFQSPAWSDLAARRAGAEVPAFSSLELSRKAQVELESGDAGKAAVTLSFDPVNPTAVNLSVAVDGRTVNQTLSRELFDRLPAAKGLLDRQSVEVPLVVDSGVGRITFKGLKDLRALAAHMNDSFPVRHLPAFRERSGFDEAVPGLGAAAALPRSAPRPVAAPAISHWMPTWVDDGGVTPMRFQSGVHPEELLLFHKDQVDRPWKVSARQFVEAADLHRVLRPSQPARDAEPAVRASVPPAEGDASFWADEHGVYLTLRPNADAPVLLRFDGQVATRLADAFRAQLELPHPAADDFLAVDSPRLRGYLFDTEARRRQLPAERAASDREIDGLVADLGSPPDLVAAVEAVRREHPAQPIDDLLADAPAPPTPEAVPATEAQLVQQFEEGFEDWLKGL